MSIRDTFQRNIDGLNDLLIKHKNDINAGVKQLAETASYGDALAYIEGKITNAVTELEKRRKSVVEILKTKLKLSFDKANEGIASEWEKAVADMKSQLELFATNLKSDLSQKYEQVQTPVIEQILIDMAKKKAFTRVTFEFLSNRLKVPKDKISEIAENLILNGKLEARIDLPTEMLTFVEEATPTLAKPSMPSPFPKPSMPSPFPKPAISPKPSLKKEGPKAISLDTPIKEGPQPIDLSLEPSELDITESPPDSIEMPPETVETETIELSDESMQTPTSQPAETHAPEPLEKQEPSTEIQSEPKVAEEEKEAASIISFFKSSVTELTEQEKEEARKKREEKKRELEARKKQKQEEAKEKEEAIKEPEIQKTEEPEIQKIEEPEIQKIEEPEIQKSKSAPSSKPESKSETVPFAPKIEPPKTSPIIAPAKSQPPFGFKPATEKPEPSKPELQVPLSGKSVSDLVIPSKPKEVLFASKEGAMGSEKGLKCIFCGKAIRKDDPSVILCPHACGALGHKAEFIKKGQCPQCKAEIKEIDVAFSELL